MSRDVPSMTKRPRRIDVAAPTRLPAGPPLTGEPTMTADNIESVLQEKRSFPPPPEFAAKAHIRSEEEYRRMWQRGKEDPAGFWGELAGNLDWIQKWTTVLEGQMPETKWFTGGKLNASHNCLDRHLATWRKNKAAIIWEGEPG